MAASKQELTRGLGSASQVSGAGGYKDARVRDLALDNPAEPLNATDGRKAILSLQRDLEGHETPAGEAVIGRVPVVSASGEPLMPCKPSKARKLLTRSLAQKRWSKLGMFYLKLRFEPGSMLKEDQQVCLAVDTGSKWDGLAVISRQGVLTSAMLVLPSKVSEKLRQRLQMRRARRYRNTPRRPKRFNNRRRLQGWIAPSQKVKVDFLIRIVDEFYKLYPVTGFAVEDVRFCHYKKRWGKYFSTVEIGKARLYQHLRELGELELYDGTETANFRKQLGLKKNPSKSKLSWDTHAIDATAIGCIKIGCRNPYPPEFWVWKRFEYVRRQLHRFEPSQGDTRKRYGGSWSIPPFRKGDVVIYRDMLARVGGFMGDRISLHSFGLNNKRFTQKAKPEDCRRLFNQQIFGSVSSQISLAGN